MKPEYDEKCIILFDGVCNLCNSSVNFIIDRDPSGKFSFATLQSGIGRDLIMEHGGNPDHLDSVVLLEYGEIYVKSEAALRIAKQLRAPWPLFYVFRLIPRILRDFIYGRIAKNRYRWFGKQPACRIPTAEIHGRFLDYNAQ